MASEDIILNTRAVAQKSVFENKLEKILARSSKKDVQYIRRRLEIYKASFE